jgi:hypothetical protein
VWNFDETSLHAVGGNWQDTSAFSTSALAQEPPDDVVAPLDQLVPSVSGISEFNGSWGMPGDWMATGYDRSEPSSNYSGTAN